MKKPPLVRYKGMPKKHSWCRWTAFRVKERNNSVNVRFVGDTGSGKSWSALAFCEICAGMLNKKFTSERIYFSIKDVIDEVAQNEPPPGTIFFIDEQQVAASSKRHQSKRAEAYAIFLSTIRSNRYIIVTTLPFTDMELKQVRRFFHVEIETHGADLNTKTVRSTPRYQEYSRQKKDKIYSKRLIIEYVDDKTGIKRHRKLSYWDIPKPSQGLVDVYERMKAQFKRNLYKKMSKELSEEGESGANPKIVAQETTLETLTDYQKAIYELMSGGEKMQKVINQKLLERGFTSSPEKVSMNLKWMRKKGVIVIK
ncbi:MAG TPA: hypothetical protein PLU55_03335 [Candidatus Pacearchaeota archaeon]|nr:hypothetical protein [Candidatus Pacearchaeota archaeon]